MNAFSGKVIQGEGIARSIGYPTLNLDRRTLIGRLPRKGVWAIWANADGAPKAAILIIGVPFQNASRNETKVEVHFLRRIHVRSGTRIVVELIRFLRPLERYKTKTALIQAIRRDRNYARRVLKTSTRSE